jgi:dephospho-CoA kinase
LDHGHFQSSGSRKEITMLRIGLTGGIGSGKTTVAQIFESLGIPVYYADDAAKRLMSEDPLIKKALLDKLGPSCFKEGILNRKYIATKVFNDPELLAWLNGLIHPATIADSQHWMQHQNGPYAIREAALLFESGADKGLDYVIGVSAPRELRLQRVMNRDATPESEVAKRMEQQWEDSKKLERCHFIIHNDEQSLLIPQVLSLDQQLRELSKQQVPN